MSTSITDSFPTASVEYVLQTIANFLTNPLPPGQKNLTLFPVPDFTYNSMYRYLYLVDNHPLLSRIPQHLLQAFRCKYTYCTHTLIVNHPDTCISLGRAFLDFVAYGIKDALRTSGVLTSSELNQVQIRRDELVRLENFRWKQADLALGYGDRLRWIPHIVFEARMNQRYEDLKGDVRDWLVASRGEVKLGVLIYYEEGEEVPDGGRSQSDGFGYSSLTQDGYTPPGKSFPPLLYFFETYRYNPITDDIKLVQERTFLFRDGEKVTPAPILEIARWDFGLPGRRHVNVNGDGDEDEDEDEDEDNSSEGWDREGGDDTMGTGDQDNESQNVCRIPLDMLQYWIEYGKFPDT